METRDLWGELEEAYSIETPRKVLREQASLLKEKTGGEVLGEVHRSEPHLGNFTYSLNFVVPALSEYRYGVLRIRHPAALYPGEMTDLVNEKHYVCANKGGLLVALEEILSSESVHRILALLIAQSVEA